MHMAARMSLATSQKAWGQGLGFRFRVSGPGFPKPSAPTAKPLNPEATRTPKPLNPKPLNP